jgi:hypothetical protein
VWEVERPPKRQINLSRGVVVSAHWLVGLLNAKCLLTSHRAQAADPRSTQSHFTGAGDACMVL